MALRSRFTCSSDSKTLLSGSAGTLFGKQQWAMYNNFILITILNVSQNELKNTPWTNQIRIITDTYFQHTWQLWSQKNELNQNFPVLLFSLKCIHEQFIQ